MYTGRKLAQWMRNRRTGIQFHSRMPTGDDVLQAGDSIIAIIGKKNLKELLKLTK